MGKLDFDTKNNGIQLTGFDELSNLMKQLPDQVARRVVRQSLFAAVKPVVKMAKALAPVRSVGDAKKISKKSDEVRYPGNLKKSIRSWSLKTGKGGSVESPVVAVGTDAGRKAKYDGWYGRLVEFGTKNSRAFPFLRPAYDANIQNVYAILRKEISIRLVATIARLRGKGKL